MKEKNLLLVVFLAGAFLISGCTSTKVERVDRNQPIDLSGYWNDFDAKLVSEEMIKDCLASSWIDVFESQNERKPVIIVGHVANRSHEHIDTTVFTKNLERELLNSGRAKFVASSEEREGLRAERDDMQQGFTDPSTIKQIGLEKGADFMLIGNVSSIKDEVKRKFVMFYQVNLELTDLTTNEKIWIGQKELKKSVKVRKFTY